jgi:hypothetical protein
MAERQITVDEIHLLSKLRSHADSLLGYPGIQPRPDLYEAAIDRLIALARPNLCAEPQNPLPSAHLSPSADGVAADTPSVGGDLPWLLANAFLKWKLPEQFSPDGGIKFEATGNKGTPHEYFYRPTGTNLFTFPQAMAMFQDLLSDPAVRESLLLLGCPK